jgi:hypothetical protein
LTSLADHHHQLHGGVELGELIAALDAVITLMFSSAIFAPSSRATPRHNRCPRAWASGRTA